MILLSTPDHVPEAGGTYSAVRDQMQLQRRLGLHTMLWARRAHGEETAYLRARDIPWNNVKAAHLAGIWHPFHVWAWAAVARRGLPFAVSPHGMFEPFILARRPLVKRLARLVVQDRILNGARLLHATSEQEKGNLLRYFPRAQVRVIPNLIDLPLIDPADARPVGARRRMLFASRLHPKKRVLDLIRWWEENHSRHPGWILVIAAPPPEDAYGREAHFRISDLASRGVGENAGFLNRKEMALELARADLFVLPTLSENFGNVIGEALASGTPAVTTRGAPWEALEREGCGWWTGIEFADFVEALEEALGQPPDRLRAMGLRGKAWVERHFSAGPLMDLWRDFWAEFGIFPS